jgi:hypothetical protein
MAVSSRRSPSPAPSPVRAARSRCGAITPRRSSRTSLSRRRTCPAARARRVPWLPAPAPVAVRLRCVPGHAARLPSAHCAHPGAACRSRLPPTTGAACPRFAGSAAPSSCARSIREARRSLWSRATYRIVRPAPPTENCYAASSACSAVRAAPLASVRCLAPRSPLAAVAAVAGAPRVSRGPRGDPAPRGRSRGRARRALRPLPHGVRAASPVSLRC